MWKSSLALNTLPNAFEIIWSREANAVNANMDGPAGTAARLYVVLFVSTENASIQIFVNASLVG